MSFQFGFTSESFSDDELEGSNEVIVKEQLAFVNPLDSNTDGFKPKILDFNELISSLVNKRLTFEQITTPKNQVLYRRELFDVKHQLMSEDSFNNESTNQILLGLDSSSDLLTNIYEGGFKSWECSIDLVDEFAKYNSSITGDILELGCGTALPSCYYFNQLLNNSNSQNLVLTDYNESVLRLVTLPNLIINWSQSLPKDELIQLQTEDDIPIVEDELQLTSKLINKFIKSLNNSKTNLVFISGSWNSDFLQLLNNYKFELIYTSETIYSLKTLPIISELLIQLYISNNNSSIFVAAKDIYFGVGGNVVEFLQYLENRRSKDNLNFNLKVSKLNEGLNRSIINIY